MGLPIFKRSCSLYPSSTSVQAPNPDPLNFKILELRQISTSVVAKIQYPDCTNFEGVKICVFAHATVDQIASLKSLDPHFAKWGIAPVARFRPTEEGWVHACLFANLITVSADGSLQIKDEK